MGIIHFESVCDEFKGIEDTLNALYTHTSRITSILPT